MSKITIIIILVIIVLGGYFLLKGPEVAILPEENGEEINLEETSNEPASSTMPVPGSEDVEEMQVASSIVYTGAGFSPSPLKIKAGETVMFQNNSLQNMWVASAMHPSHSKYSGTSLSEHCPDSENVAFDACRGIPPGESWSFTFTKTGTWGYHDHLHSNLFGQIIVE